MIAVDLQLAVSIYNSKVYLLPSIQIYRYISMLFVHFSLNVISEIYNNDDNDDDARSMMKMAKNSNDEAEKFAIHLFHHKKPYSSSVFLLTFAQGQITLNNQMYVSNIKNQSSLICRIYQTDEHVNDEQEKKKKYFTKFHSSHIKYST